MNNRRQECNHSIFQETFLTCHTGYVNLNTIFISFLFIGNCRVFKIDIIDNTYYFLHPSLITNQSGLLGDMNDWILAININLVFERKVGCMYTF